MAFCNVEQDVPSRARKRRELASVALRDSATTEVPLPLGAVAWSLPGAETNLGRYSMLLTGSRTGRTQLGGEFGALPFHSSTADPLISSLTFGTE